MFNCLEIIIQIVILLESIVYLPKETPHCMFLIIFYEFNVVRKIFHFDCKRCFKFITIKKNGIQ